MYYRAKKTIPAHKIKLQNVYKELGDASTILYNSRGVLITIKKKIGDMEIKKKKALIW